MKFLSEIIFAFIISIFITALPSCSNNEKKDVAAEKKREAKTLHVDSLVCKGYKIKILKTNNYRDTTIMLRQSITKDSTLMVSCDTNQISFDLEKIIFKSKYLPGHWWEGHFSFLMFIKSDGNKKEIGFFNYNKKTSVSLEVQRFLIKNNKIIGINSNPNLLKDYITPEQFDYIEKNTEID